MQIISNETKFRKEIFEYIKKDYDGWFFEKIYNKATKEEILMILELVKVSNKLKLITFCNNKVVENSYFDFECGEKYLDTILTNQSLKYINLS